MVAGSVGRRLAWSGRSASQVTSGGVAMRSSVDSYSSDNGAIRPQPAQRPFTSPQLSGYPSPDFFMAK